MRITKSKIVCIFLILAGCSPTKRLSNLLNKNPYLVTSFDTTIFFETKSIDTSFIFDKNAFQDGAKLPFVEWANDNPNKEIKCIYSPIIQNRLFELQDK